ncbi:unnamed protein product [Rotaria sp. Silwood1]|nr:unnamed protein product [Rotaria sp. Silwood1]CAF1485865.1 unnamed protein product [Rotaria sp. Silwood1]
MTESASEQMMPLNMSLYDIRKDNQINKYFKFHNNITTINRMGPYGITALHIANIYEYNEAVQLLLTNSTLKSFENISYQLTSDDESKMDEIKKLFLKNSNLFHSHEEMQHYDYIEWSLISNNLIEKRKQFREQIDLYKTYDNQHHLITKLLIEIIEYYLNEYLIQQEQFPRNEAKKLEFFFKQAIQEQNYLKYFIKAYTLTNNFYRVLNKHLALYILDYFDTSSYSSSPTKYHLINCLVHIVTLLINHPDIHKYKYKGIAYRGLLMTRNDLERYTIGTHILNRSFVSTSKNPSVAKMFADNSEQNILQQTSDHHDLVQVSVLLKYTIKQNQTAIDIEHISTVEDEKEVLILPFSVFQIKDRIDNSPKLCPPVLVEIELEECEDGEQINTRKERRK